MNDVELITAVRDAFSDIHSVTPVDTVVARSRTLRFRRGAAIATAATALTTVAAVGVAGALPGSHSAARQHVQPQPTGSGVQLAAWTLVRQSNGTIRITFHEAADAAGLQRRLRADGVPASVRFSGHQNPACQPFNGPALGVLVGPVGIGGPRHLFAHPGLKRGLPPVPPRAAYHSNDALVLRPAKLPRGAGLQLEISGKPGASDNFELFAMIVKTSPNCTGS